MSAGLRSLIQNLCLASVSAAVVPIGAELYLRASGFAAPRFRDTARIANGRRSVMLDCYPENPGGYFDIDLRDPATLDRYLRLGVTRAAAVAQRAPFAVEFKYNALRYRDVEFGARRPGVRRVLVLGDSFTEGWGVKEKDTYPRRLEALLNREEPNGWEVLNCGRRGADFPGLFDLFEQVEALEPDVLVYGMVLNDAARSAAYEARQPYLNDWILNQGQMVGGRPVPPLGPLRSRLLMFARDRIESRRIDRASTRWYRELYAEPNADGWARTQGYLREMNRRMRVCGRALLVACWPLLVDLNGDYPFAAAHEAIARACLPSGIPFHDLRVALRVRPTESLWVHAVDRHPNAAAHELAARDLAPVVRGLAPPPGR